MEDFYFYGKIVLGILKLVFSLATLIVLIKWSRDINKRKYY